MAQQPHTLDDIVQHYQQFIRKSDCPKIENLTNWGRNRLFFSQYFQVKDCQYQKEKILIEYNQRTYAFDIANAPDFLDQSNYLAWLQQHLLQH